ncbi:MAG TPA: hypothetical protein VND23_06905 [Acidimicrobiales bacterium]|nr:hypothetical protein [Acidimicrobiales bacterium]
MRGLRERRGTEPARAAIGETVTMLRRYVVQETLGPLRHVARTVAFGVAGSLLLGTGGVVLLLAVLRVLETETGGTFAGSWSFAPYLLSALVAAVFAGVAAWLGLRGARSGGRSGARSGGRTAPGPTRDQGGQP